MDKTNAQLHGRKTSKGVPVVVLLGALAATGCAHGTISAVSPGGSSPLRGSVAEVTVTAPSISQERRTVYDRLDGDRTIEHAIISRLADDGHYDEAGDTRVSVEITVFRLRSAATAFWAGFFAGVDMLEGKVVASQREDSGTPYVFKLSSSEEWYFKYSASARLRSLANELAEKISTLFDDSSS